MYAACASANRSDIDKLFTHYMCSMTAGASADRSDNTKISACHDFLWVGLYTENP